MFLFEGRGRLDSPILKEVIGMIPKVAPVPVIQYSAKHVARCIEYEAHTDQRGYWRALRKEWTRVVKLRAFWHVDSISTYGQRVELANAGT